VGIKERYSSLYYCIYTLIMYRSIQHKVVLSGKQSHDYVQEYTAQSGVEWQTKPECYICCSYITVRVGSEAIGKLNCNCPLKPFIS